MDFSFMSVLHFSRNTTNFIYYFIKVSIQKKERQQTIENK